MFSRLVSPEDAAYLLDLENPADLDKAVTNDLLKPAQIGPQGRRFRLADVVMCKLAQTIGNMGVESLKAARYAEAVLGPRLDAHDKNVLDWIENETQELYCLIEDNQLARIFLRGRDGLKEVDVGAVKPVLFPATRCEINVFRVIRPVVWKARQLLGPEGL